MKARITFDVEPYTTYVYAVTTMDEAMAQAYELSRVMRRTECNVEFGGIVSRLEFDVAPTVQIA